MLPLSSAQTDTYTFANRADPDDTAEPCHQNIHYLSCNYCTLCNIRYSEVEEPISETQG